MLDLEVYLYFWNRCHGPIPPGWLSREQVAIRVERGVSAVEKMVITGRLPQPYKFGSRCILFSEAEIDAFLVLQPGLFDQS